MWGETLLSYKSPWGLVGRGNHPTCTAKYAHRISARIRQRRTWQQRGRTCSRGTCSLLAGFLAPVALLSGLRWQRGLVKRLLIGGLRFRSTQGIPLHRPPPFPRRAAPPQPPHRRPPLEMAQQVEVRYPGFSAQRGVAVARTSLVAATNGDWKKPTEASSSAARLNSIERVRGKNNLLLGAINLE